MHSCVTGLFVTVARLEGELSGVEALQELRLELQDKKEVCASSCCSLRP